MRRSRASSGIRGELSSSLSKRSKRPARLDEFELKKAETLLVDYNASAKAKIDHKWRHDPFSRFKQQMKAQNNGKIVKNFVRSNIAEAFAPVSTGSAVRVAWATMGKQMQKIGENDIFIP